MDSFFSSGPVPLVVAIEGNGEASSLLSPQPLPSHSITLEDDDEGRSVMSRLEPTAEAQVMQNKEGEQSPKKSKRDKTTVRHDYDMEILELGLFGCICKKEFETLQNLQGHIGYYKKERNIPCHVCGKLFSYQSYLKAHLKQSHKIGKDNGVETRG